MNLSINLFHQICLSFSPCTKAVHIKALRGIETEKKKQKKNKAKIKGEEILLKTSHSTGPATCYNINPSRLVPFPYFLSIPSIKHDTGLSLNHQYETYPVAFLLYIFYSIKVCDDRKSM